MPKSTKTTLTYFWQKKTTLSFIAIIFVIVIHNSATMQYNLPADPLTATTNFIHNFFAYDLGAIAVPFFFLVSGISFFRNYHPRLYRTKLRSRVKTLLIPYLIWNIIGMLFAILYTYTPLSGIISGREAFTPSLANILQGIFLYKYNFHFWFLYDLIIFTILAPLFHLLLSKKWLAYLSAIFLLILPCFIDSLLNINFYFIIFYYLGCLIGKYHLSTFTRPASRRTSITASIVTIILLAIKFLSIYNIIPLPTIISQIILVLLLLSVWFFADLPLRRAKPHQFTAEFFPVYALHPYFVSVIVKIIYLLTPQTSYMLLINELTSTIITLVVVTAVAYLWHRHLPTSYSILFGSRPSVAKNVAKMSRNVL